MFKDEKGSWQRNESKKMLTAVTAVTAGERMLLPSEKLSVRRDTSADAYVANFLKNERQQSS